MNPSPGTHELGQPETDPAPAPREVLAFRLGGEEYGIDIQRVQEIRSYERPTRIAHAPDFVKGVVNLRGAIVPIVDLRLRLGLEQAAYDAFTVVIVLNVGHRTIGVVVDAVSDVAALDAAQLRAAPALRRDRADEPLLAIATLEARLLLLLDIDRLLGGAAMGSPATALQ